MTSPAPSARVPRPISSMAPAGEPRSCAGNWGYQWCTEMVQPFTSGTARDMFWPYEPYDYNASAEACVRDWGVTPREGWARVGLGGKRIGDASKILFSNGRLDPWSGGGVLEDISDDLPAVLIPSGTIRPRVTTSTLRPRVTTRPRVTASTCHHASTRHLTSTWQVRTTSTSCSPIPPTRPT